MKATQMAARRSHETGFSLTELMIVIVIIGILLGLVFSNMDVLDKANAQKAEQEIGKLKINLEMYRADNGAFPPSGALNALVTNPGNAPRWKQYMKEIPKDPWSNEYRYLNPGTHGKEVDIFSIGPDKREGTDDDIGSWRLER